MLFNYKYADKKFVDHSISFVVILKLVTVSIYIALLIAIGVIHIISEFGTVDGFGLEGFGCISSVTFY